MALVNSHNLRCCCTEGQLYTAQRFTNKTMVLYGGCYIQDTGFCRGDVYSLKLSYKRGRGAKSGALQIQNNTRAANSMAKSLECAESVNQQHDNSNEDNYPPTDRLMQLGRAALSTHRLIRELRKFHIHPMRQSRPLAKAKRSSTRRESRIGRLPVNLRGINAALQRRRNNDIDPFNYQATQ